MTGVEVLIFCFLALCIVISMNFRSWRMDNLIKVIVIALACPLILPLVIGDEVTEWVE